MKIKCIIFVSVLFVWSIIASAESIRQVPLLFSYQGYIFDEGGNFYPDGATNLKFLILDSVGNILYEEDQDLEVIDGQVSAMVGNGIDPENEASTGGIPSNVFDPVDSRFLQVGVSGEEPSDPMEIVTVPYSLWSNVALGVVDGAITEDMLGEGIISKKHLSGDLLSQVFPEGIPKTMLPTDTIYYDTFEGFRSVIMSDKGAANIGVDPNFNYSVSQSVQDVLGDLDASIKARENELIGYRNTITSIAGADNVGIESDFVYSASQTVQKVLKDIDTAVQEREAGNLSRDGSEAMTGDLNIHSGSDIVGYSDEGVTEKYKIEAATGDITTSGSITSPSLPPIGTIIPFYDFDGALAFDDDYWSYCDGRTVEIAGIGFQELPDLSGRYLVGFGTDDGGDMASAAWDDAAVGNVGHVVNLKHSHENSTLSLVKPALVGSIGIAGEHEHTVYAHYHGVGSMSVASNVTGITLYREGGGNSSGGKSSFDISDHGNAGYISAFINDPGHTHSLSGHVGLNEVYGGKNGDENQSTSQNGSHSHNNGSLAIEDPGISGSTGYALSTAQSIQPRSIRVKYIMRIK